MKTANVIVLLLISLNIFGQKYGNIWQFEKGAGIDFNSCTPTYISNGRNAGYEGVSCISDTSGQILFYTNSDTVWNKLNASMPNGILINSGGTLSQVIILPKPLSNSLYYVITTKVQAQGSLTLQYHIVDMSLNSGLGDVSSKNNILSTLNITEQIAATLHSNGTDIWLMSHEYGSNHFLAYLITSSGITSTPVISSVGAAQMPCSNNTNARGEIKFSPNGTKIAFNGNGIGPGGGINTDSTNILALFDFDNTTGIVSNPINLPYSRGDYGLAFSPDNSKLYGTTWKASNFTLADSNYLYQFDLLSGDSLTIANSKKIIFSQPIMEIFGDLKAAPDGKVYVARYQSGYLGVINSPNQAGTACNYISNGFYLQGKTSGYGLNNYIEYKNYCDGTGISDHNFLSNSLLIYPNPSNEIFNISLPTQQTFTLQIIDITGRIVYNNKNATGNITVDATGFSSGVYFVKAVNERTVFTGKLVKQ
ncbi:MAG: T9SS type A sorting domain-containing protein [Bacteroidota bacterium]